MTIEHREKIGLGTWEHDRTGSALNDVDRAGFAWYYTWIDWALRDIDTTPEATSYVGMIWDETHATSAALDRIVASGARELLGFNEPDLATQAGMTVAQALALWPLLQSTGLRMGSPAASQTRTLGADSWLGQFMAGAEKQGLRVDFISVHYYSDDGDVGAFKAWLEAVHAQYHKPIWVTEWVLADWTGVRSFTVEEQAAFARAGTEMMDDLDFVERQAWFAAYEGGDGYHLNSAVFDETGALTAVGRTFAELNAPSAVIAGAAGADSLTGTLATEKIRGLAGNDRLLAVGGADTLQGGSGNDTLEGGTGATRLEGGEGNDTYVVSAAGTVLVEVAGEGRDLVRASVSLTLAAEIEDLVLTGTTAIDGTGNGLANQLTGNGAANRLAGLAGDDLLEGGAGNDTLTGGDGADRLDGGAGTDRLEGGAGDDIYLVDVGGDLTIEAAGGGRDEVIASLGWTLGAHLERLTLSGAADISGTGNELANTITGNAGANAIWGMAGDDWLLGGAGRDSLTGAEGNDTLDGGAGADRMAGGTGDDTYIIDNASDQAVDLASGGTDLVRASVGCTLGSNIEDLVLTGTAAINGGGNVLANRLTGNAAANALWGGSGNDSLSGMAGYDSLYGGDGHDRLDGGAGNDLLFGGCQADVFIFGGGMDRITDYQDGIDRIHIEATVWGGTAKTVAQVLALATVSGNAVCFDFGAGNTLRVDGVCSTASLADELSISWPL